MPNKTRAISFLMAVMNTQGQIYRGFLRLQPPPPSHNIKCSTANVLCHGDAIYAHVAKRLVVIQDINNVVLKFGTS